MWMSAFFLESLRNPVLNINVTLCLKLTDHSEIWSNHLMIFLKVTKKSSGMWPVWCQLEARFSHESSKLTPYPLHTEAFFLLSRIADNSFHKKTVRAPLWANSYDLKSDKWKIDLSRFLRTNLNWIFKSIRHWATSVSPYFISTELATKAKLHLHE